MMGCELPKLKSLGFMRAEQCFGYPLGAWTRVRLRRSRYVTFRGASAAVVEGLHFTFARRIFYARNEFSEQPAIFGLE
jgi:hypothetical protein